MGTFRMARINKQLQREISLLLEQRVKNDSVRNAIITGVDCARNLERAKVFFTTLNPKDREPLLEELQNVKGALRTMLGQILTLRRVPALEFVIDSSLDYGEHIDRILNRIGLESVTSVDNDDEEEESEEEDE